MKFNKTINIGNHLISEHGSVFIIAEAGVNHNGSMEIAKQMIDVACKANVNAIKFQIFSTEKLILESVDKAPYQKKTTEKNESQFEMLKKLEFKKKHFLELSSYCKMKKILFLATAFDDYSLDELDSINVDAYKISSTDITNIPFLKKAAKKGKPLIISTGMAFMSEVEFALEEIHKCNKNVILLQCTSSYPTNDNEVNLNVINTYKKQFDLIVGYSDHTRGIGASPYAVCMGAKVIEKHFTMDKKMKGPDHLASLSPRELNAFVKEIRKVETYLGSNIKKPTLSETKTRVSLQKCIVASARIKKGEAFSEKNITTKRTGGMGIPASNYYELIKKEASKEYRINDIIYE